MVNISTFERFYFLWQKICFYCGSEKVTKRGKDRGVQRWFCKDCRRTFKGNKATLKGAVNEAFSKGNLTVEDLSKQFGVSKRTIHRLLEKSYSEALPEPEHK